MKFRVISERFEEKWTPEPFSGCHIWTGTTNSDGYGMIRRNNERVVQAHRISWELNKGPIPAGLCVLHRCDTPSCVNPDHLFLGTKSDNTRDACRKGRQHIPDQRGERGSNARLTSAEVQHIRAARNQTQQSLADRFGVCRSAIGGIRRRRTWKHVA